MRRACLVVLMIFGMLAAPQPAAEANGVTYYQYSWDIDKYSSVVSLTLGVNESYTIPYELHVWATRMVLDVGVEDLDECVTVSDDPFGAFGPFCAPANLYIYYSQTVSYPAVGVYSVVNRAELVTADTGTMGSDSWTVQITVTDSPPIPEPASLLLLGTGLIGVVRAVRRRRG